jgi:hypothetical protein
VVRSQDAIIEEGGNSWSESMAFLLKFHGEMRWIVALVGAAAAIRFAAGWLRHGEFKAVDRILMLAFTIVLDINLLLGLALLFSLPGGLVPARLEHATTMILALVAAHSSAAWRRSDDSARKFRNNFVVVVVALVLVAVGVIRLRGGWIF